MHSHLHGKHAHLASVRSLDDCITHVCSGPWPHFSRHDASTLRTHLLALFIFLHSIAFTTAMTTMCIAWSPPPDYAVNGCFNDTKTPPWRLSQTAALVMLYTVLKCCAWTSTGPETVPRSIQSNIGPGWSRNRTQTCSNSSYEMPIQPALQSVTSHSTLCSWSIIFCYVCSVLHYRSPNFRLSPLRSVSATLTCSQEQRNSRKVAKACSPWSKFRFLVHCGVILRPVVLRGLGDRCGN